MIKTIDQCQVVEIPSENLVTEEKLYRFTRKGTPVMSLPDGSLIYTGEIVKGPGGFPHAVFGVWEGKNIIKKRKLIFIKTK